MIPDAKKATEVKGPKILTPEQMLQGLPIALGQLKAGNNSENLLNRIRQIVYFLYQSKKKKKKNKKKLIFFIKKKKKKKKKKYTIT